MFERINNQHAIKRPHRPENVALLSANLWPVEPFFVRAPVWPNTLNMPLGRPICHPPCRLNNDFSIIRGWHPQRCSSLGYKPSPQQADLFPGLSVYLFVSLFICLFFCLLHFSQRFEPSLMKFLVGWGTSDWNLIRIWTQDFFITINSCIKSFVFAMWQHYYRQMSEISDRFYT